MDGVKNALETNFMERELVLENLNGLAIRERDLTLTEQYLIRKVLHK